MTKKARPIGELRDEHALMVKRVAVLEARITILTAERDAARNTLQEKNWREYLANQEKSVGLGQDWK